MTKKELLQFCRYYKGEKANPYDSGQDKAFFWDYERVWIEANYTESGREMLSVYIGDYASAGLALFEMQDDTPASLKALLFNRYAKSFYSIYDAAEPFKKFYKDVYQA